MEEAIRRIQAGWMGGLFSLCVLLLIAGSSPSFGSASERESLPAAEASAEPAPPCRRPELESVGFLEGEWTVLSKVLLGSGEWEETTARSTILPILRGCALQENWVGRMRGEPLESVALWAYDVRREKWDFFSIDTVHGNLNGMEGGWAGPLLLFYYTETRGGRLLVDRMTLTPTSPGGFERTLETSSDGGASWRTIWRLVYRRHE